MRRLVPYPCVPVRYQPRFVLPAVCAILAIALILAIVLDDGHGGSHTSSSTPNGDFDGAAFPPGVRAHDFT